MSLPDSPLPGRPPAENTLGVYAEIVSVRGDGEEVQTCAYCDCNKHVVTQIMPDAGQEI